MIKTLAAIVIAISLLCCNRASTPSTTDFDAEWYNTKYAERFSINALKDSTAILIKITKPNLHKTEYDNLIITLDDQTAAKNVANATSITPPIKRVITLSHSNIEMFDTIGESDKIVGVTEIEKVSNKTILQAYNRGKSLSIESADSINYHAIIALRPDIVLLSGDHDQVLGIEAELDRLGIKHIYIGNLDEPSPLAKAEWLVVIGELCGEREVAKQRFNEIEQRYLAIQDSLNQLLVAPITDSTTTL